MLHSTPNPLQKHKTFRSWRAAAYDGFLTRGRWLDDGFALKTGAESYASVHVEKKGVKSCIPLNVGKTFFPVYHQSQVRLLKEPQRSRRMLIGRFLGFMEWCGYRRLDGEGIRQLHGDSIHGSVKDLIYRSFQYNNRTSGIKIPIAFSLKHGDKSEFVADTFYVRVGELTTFFVLDLDNHRPSWLSTDAHLLLVRRLVGLLPELLERVGGGRVFYDYTRAAPQGIHIWIQLKHRMSTKYVHQLVREFLVENSDQSLDEQLVRCGLPRMDAIEILPTESHLIRFFGAYDRSVFTTHELRAKDNAFDADGLLSHLTGTPTIGDPCDRYAELARAGLDEGGVIVPNKVTISPEQAVLLGESPKHRDGTFVYLVDACLNGVTKPDVLFGTYLRPLATALYFRDLHDHPQRDNEVVATLMKWLETKHNWLVDRVKDKNTKNLRGIIRRLIRNMPNAPNKVRAYWTSVRNKDLAHPERRISLVRCMQATLDRPFPVTKGNLAEVRRLVAGDESCPPPLPSAVQIVMPATVEERLRHHLRKAEVAPGVRTERIVRFAGRVIEEIGLEGRRRIHWGRINELAGLGKGRRHGGRYKRLLIGAGILERGGGRKVGVRSNEYRLSDQVVDELHREMGRATCSPPSAP